MMDLEQREHRCYLLSSLAQRINERNRLWRLYLEDVGCWMLDVGCWILDVGCWILDIGVGDDTYVPEPVLVLQNEEDQDQKKIF